MSSCISDYDITKSFGGKFTPRVVFNSIINPDSVIKGDLFWSKHVHDKDKHKRVDEFSMKLYEEDILIYEFQGVDGVFNTDIYPKPDSEYRVEIDVPNYGIVKAQTYIPINSTFVSEYNGMNADSVNYEAYHFFTINSVYTIQKPRSFWIKSRAIFSDNSQKYISTFYTNNPFCDQSFINKDGGDILLTGTDIFYFDFIRIPYENTLQGTGIPLSFCVNNNSYPSRRENVFAGVDEWGDDIWEEVITKFDRSEIILITPSDDYDKYYRSLHLQRSSINTDIPIFNQPTHVYSNIENGIGIFAGYIVKKTSHEFEVLIWQYFL